MSKPRTAKNNAAEHHHYVPKFMLRHFLPVAGKEQVSVFDKDTGKHFPTAIANIMAERRFNDFQFSETQRVTYEDAMCRIEDQVLPTYERIIANRCLDQSSDERMNLALLLTIQFLRTKAYRDLIIEFDKMLADKTEAMGYNVAAFEGYVPPTEDNIKARHLEGIGKALADFGGIIALKDFLLIQSAPGRSFYLGDNPVTLHNDQKFGPYGNLGLSLPGIQIYMPLSADLMLSAFCPSIFAKGNEAYEQAKQAARAEAFKAFTAGKITADWMRKVIEAAEGATAPSTLMLRHFQAGTAFVATDELMDFSNSMQVRYATRFVVCKGGDFALAKRYVKEFPGVGGIRIRPN